MGMDNFLTQAAIELSPKPNLHIMRGIADSQMKYFVDSIGAVWNTVAKEFPPEVSYLGWRQCTALEEYMFEAKPTKTVVCETDVARNSLHLVMFRIEYRHPNGTREEVPVYMYMPHTQMGGLLWLSGAQWANSPMLGDQVLSFEKDRVFCQLARAKFHIENVNHCINVDGSIIENNVPWGIVYNVHKPKPIIKIALIHYILAVRGLRKSIEQLLPGMAFECFDGDIDEEKYPTDKWVHIKSGRPKYKPFFGGSDITFVIDRQKWEEAGQPAKTIMASIFFVLDRFSKAGSEVWRLEIKAAHESSENISNWRVAMGAILWESTKNPFVALEDINKHIKSLDRYIDDLVQPQVKRIGFDVDNLFDFFGQIILRWEDWRLNGHKLSAPVCNKEINALYQMYSGIMKAIFKFHFNLENEAAKGAIAIDKLKDLLKTFIRPRMIFSVRKEAPRYIAPIAFAGDNAFCKPSSIVVPQRGSSGGGEGHGAAGTRLHSTLPEVTSAINITKKDSGGLTRLNPYVQLDNLMYVIRDPELAAISDRVQAILDKEMKTTAVAGAVFEDVDEENIVRDDDN